MDLMNDDEAVHRAKSLVIEAMENTKVYIRSSTLYQLLNYIEKLTKDVAGLRSELFEYEVKQMDLDDPIVADSEPAKEIGENS